MFSLRPHLRLCTMIWLICQTLGVSAFMPAQCCAVHEAAAAASQECTGDADGLCPMHASRGEECPLHAADGTAATPCVMRGLCNGPEAALSVLLSAPGILTHQAQVLQVGSNPMVRPAPSPAFDAPATHDTPPPRL